MHVAIDGVGNHVGGGWSVLVRTIAGIVADPRIGRLTVFGSPLDVVAGPPPRHAKLRWVERGREHRSPRARLAWFAVGLDTQVERIEADVVITMNGVGRTERPRICFIQQAFTVAGKLSRVRPRGFAAKLAVLRRETRRSATSASAIVVQTSWMLSKVSENLGLSALVLPLGVPQQRARDDVRVAQGVLVVGADLPYKRRHVAAEAVEIARRTTVDLELTVVDGVTPARAETLLRRAALLLAPSEIESFGLPIVEAFAAGCPVIATDQPWARAVADNAAMYFDPGSATSAARRITECLRDVTLLDDLAVRGTARLEDLWALRPYAGLVDLAEEVA